MIAQNGKETEHRKRYPGRFSKMVHPVRATIAIGESYLYNNGQKRVTRYLSYANCQQNGETITWLVPCFANHIHLYISLNIFRPLSIKFIYIR